MEFVHDRLNMLAGVLLKRDFRALSCFLRAAWHRQSNRAELTYK